MAIKNGVKDVAQTATDVTAVKAVTDALKVISGTSPNTAGTANTATRIELDSNASAVDGAYDPAQIVITGGTGAGQARQIWEYVGATKLAYINRDWKVVPDSTSAYTIFYHAGNTHVNEGVAQAGGASTITLNTLASDQNNVYLGQMIFIASGTGQDQARMCVGYNGTTKVATVDAPWIVQPDATSVYCMLPYPGFVHGAAGADSAANVLSRDVVGNKSDAASTAATASVVALLREILAEVVEVDDHIHNVTRWWGATGAPDETNAVEANVTRPFAATSGADTWGAAIPILGASDNPVLSGQTHFDARRILVTDLDDDTTPWRLRIIYGTGTSAAAISAGQWTEVMTITNAVPGNRAGGIPENVKTIPLPVGTKLWAQAWNDTGGEILSFFWEAHGYPAPTFP